MLFNGVCTSSKGFEADPLLGVLGSGICVAVFLTSSAAACDVSVVGSPDLSSGGGGSGAFVRGFFREGPMRRKVVRDKVLQSILRLS